ncbi:hypothetical protein J6590_025178 [Homalodisca vitripennis]|nr:hypothetical protein J6590_025178 [Homalodisca vitripennis]
MYLALYVHINEQAFISTLGPLVTTGARPAVSKCLCVEGSDDWSRDVAPITSITFALRPWWSVLVISHCHALQESGSRWMAAVTVDDLLSLEGDPLTFSIWRTDWTKGEFC